MQKNNINLPITYTKLSNGLRAVIAQDHSSPVATVAVFYQVGFRSEIKGRTGFAHLFEHLMFQGTKNIPKNQFIKLIEETGGIVNGTTQPDFTNYFETLPAQAVDMALWIEFERMINPQITQSELDNQRDVVKNEIKVNVLNRPYGGFPWIDMSEKAFTNWQNNHNGYGDMEDLSAASIKDVKSFYSDYYNPSNATIVVTGDVNPNDVIKKIEELFSQIPVKKLVTEPDLTEPQQKKESKYYKTDPLAPKPALCIAYHAPPRMSDDFFALGLFDQMFIQGEDSLLNKVLVREKGITDDIFGGISFEGNMFTSKDPMLWHFSMIYDDVNSSEQIIKFIDQLLDHASDEKIIAELLNVARTKIDSSLFHVLQRGPYKGIGLAEMLAAFSFYDDDPFLINEIQDRFYDISTAKIANVIQHYLKKTNRNILFVKPGV
tara:strand:- start:4465 stop:5763 length:1299 start_codon:yes stop_codon:yes gene_type:complete